MLRRDEFIAKLAEYNDTKGIDEALIGLEKYVDGELVSEANIISMINSVDAGSDFSVGSTIEVVNELKPSNDIHRDINVVGGEEKADVYYVWDEELTDKSGNSAVEKPWEDRTVLETNFVPEIRIQLPENTNKNVAYKLVQKYLGIEEFDDDGVPTVGYWGLIVKPNDPDTNEPESTSSEDAVRLEYDRDSGILTMVFKIYL